MVAVLKSTNVESVAETEQHDEQIARSNRIVVVDIGHAKRVASKVTQHDQDVCDTDDAVEIQITKASGCFASAIIDDSVGSSDLLIMLTVFGTGCPE